MQTSEIKTLIIYTIRNFIGIFVISFILEFSFKLYKTENFETAFSYWFTTIISIRKIIIWTLISFVLGVYHVKFRKR